MTKYGALIQIRGPQSLADAVDTASARRLTNRSEYVRQALVERLQADGFGIEQIAGTGGAEDAHSQYEQYARVDGDRVLSVGGKGPKPEDGNLWLPVVSVDEQPFDPSLHYRLAPYFKRAGDRVLRIYPIIGKADHEAALIAGRAC